MKSRDKLFFLAVTLSGLQPIIVEANSSLSFTAMTDLKCSELPKVMDDEKIRSLSFDLRARPVEVPLSDPKNDPVEFDESRININVDRLYSLATHDLMSKDYGEGAKNTERGIKSGGPIPIHLKESPTLEKIFEEASELIPFIGYLTSPTGDRRIYFVWTPSPSQMVDISGFGDDEFRANSPVHVSNVADRNVNVHGLKVKVSDIKVDVAQFGPIVPINFTLGTELINFRFNGDGGDHQIKLIGFAGVEGGIDLGRPVGLPTKVDVSYKAKLGPLKFRGRQHDMEIDPEFQVRAGLVLSGQFTSNSSRWDDSEWMVFTFTDGEEFGYGGALHIAIGTHNRSRNTRYR